MNIKILMIIFFCIAHQLTASDTFSSYIEKFGALFYKKSDSTSLMSDGSTQYIFKPALKTPKEIWNDNPCFVAISGVVCIYIGYIGFQAYKRKAHHQKRPTNR